MADAGDTADAPRSPLPPGVRPVVVASHRRSGTHLMLDFLRRQFDACRPAFRFGVNPHRYLYFVLDRFSTDHRFHVGVDTCARVVRSMDVPPLKTHSTPDFSGFIEAGRAFSEAALREGVVLYCVRDVRAVLASLHAFERTTGATKAGSLSDFVREENAGGNRVRLWADHVRAWLDLQPAAHVVHYEQMVGDPSSMLDELAELLGHEPRRRQPFLPPKLKHRQQLWLARLTGIPNSTNVIGRKFTIAIEDWRTAYTDADLGFLEAHAGDTMRRLGYISGDDWSTPKR
ncbi:MAG: sulfotransferase domain-containing protein [Phycisphaerales bacterium]|jgi:hypothetical protein